MSTTEFKKSDKCYDCCFRRELPGSAHSQCAHKFVLNNKNEDILASLLGLIGKSVMPLNTKCISKMGIKYASYGYNSGWFNWPVNFDPTWLDSCNGFKLLTYPHWKVYYENSPNDDIDNVIVYRCNSIKSSDNIHYGKKVSVGACKDYVVILSAAELASKYPGIGIIDDLEID